MNEQDKQQVLKFVRSQKLLTLATLDGNEPWISNVYFSVDDDMNFFFVGPPDTNHSKHIAESPKVAFTVAWHDDKNLVNRKAIQATGACTKLSDPKLITKFLKNHHKAYPIWKNRITYLNIKNKIIASRPYMIKPDYIKFWNDELYGEEGVKEFHL